MGYVGYFYVEAKSFEFRSDVCVGDGVRLAERNKGLFRAVFLNTLSVGWLRRSMEELKQVGEIRDFCRTYRVGSTVLILQRRGNDRGRFLELSEYAFGGRRSSVMIPEGRVGCGWANCLAQLRRLEKSLERKATGGKTGGNIPSAARKEMKPAFRDGRTFAAALIGHGSEPERGESSKGNLGISGEQSLSILARSEKQAAMTEGGDCTAVGGAQSVLNDPVVSVEGQLQLAEFKKLLVSIREEVTRWLGRLELGLLRDEVKSIESPNKGQTDNEVGQVALGFIAQDQEGIKDKGKEAAVQEFCGSPQLTYKRRVLLRQKVQTGSTTESVEEKAEQRQISPMSSLEVISDPVHSGSGSGRLGSRDAVHAGISMEDNGAGSEGDEGVIGGLKTATEEATPIENQVSLVYSPGPAENQEEEERFHEGSESERLGKLGLDSGLSVEAGDGREVGEQGFESLKQAEFDIGLGEMAAQCRGLEMIEVSGKVDVVMSDLDCREKGEGVNSLALMTSLEENLGDNELLDVMPLAVMEKDLGNESSDWVFERIRGFCKVVGISCPGLKEKMMDLFNGIEAQRFSDRVRHNNNSSTMGNRGQREVKRLECSVNYDGKGGQSSRLTRKGRVGNCLC
jgi:hypothetical protein